MGGKQIFWVGGNCARRGMLSILFYQIECFGCMGKRYGNTDNSVNYLNTQSSSDLDCGAE